MNLGNLLSCILETWPNHLSQACYITMLCDAKEISAVQASFCSLLAPLAGLVLHVLLRHWKHSKLWKGYEVMYTILSCKSQRCDCLQQHPSLLLNNVGSVNCLHCSLRNTNPVLLVPFKLEKPLPAQSAATGLICHILSPALAS